MTHPNATFSLQIPLSWKRKIAENSERPGLIPADVARGTFHRIRVAGTITMHDYENFGPDEHGDFNFLQETMMLTDGLTTTLLRTEQRFGGEERTEIEIFGALSFESGACIVQIAVRFYEGATEGTTELEDSRQFQAIVPVGGTANFDVRLANDENDWSRIFGSISNMRV